MHFASTWAVHSNLVVCMILSAGQVLARSPSARLQQLLPSCRAWQDISSQFHLIALIATRMCPSGRSVMLPSKAAIKLSLCQQFARVSLGTAHDIWSSCPTLLTALCSLPQFIIMHRAFSANTDAVCKGWRAERLYRHATGASGTALGMVT